MSRPPRPDLPGYAQHVVQRGNNRLPCFLDDVDRRRYLHLLGESLGRYDCALHAYVLMDNHVHLLVTPSAPGALPRLMQTFGRNYAVWFNRRHERTGTLWEGRYKGHLVDNDAYLLACHRYIELNPVRAAMVANPADYRWSSHRGNAGMVGDPLLTPHPLYLALHPTGSKRPNRYRAMFAHPLPQQTIDDFRRYLAQRGTLGNESFRRLTASRLQRFTGVRPAHRPAGDTRNPVDADSG